MGRWATREGSQSWNRGKSYVSSRRANPVAAEAYSYYFASRHSEGKDMGGIDTPRFTTPDTRKVKMTMPLTTTM
jgi:hypothetical protein